MKKNKNGLTLTGYPPPRFIGGADDGLDSLCVGRVLPNVLKAYSITPSIRLHTGFRPEHLQPRKQENPTMTELELQELAEKIAVKVDSKARVLAAIGGYMTGQKAPKKGQKDKHRTSRMKKRHFQAKNTQNQLILNQEAAR